MLRLPKAVYDEHLPALLQAANTEAVREIFQRELPVFAAGRYRIFNVALKQFQHRPGRKAELIYSVQYEDTQAQLVRREFACAMVLPADEAEAQYHAAQQRPYVQIGIVPALHFFPSLSMILWCFPNDPKMKHLHRVVDEASCAELVRKHWERLQLEPAWQLQSVETEIGKYAPQDRCTCKHTLTLTQNGNTKEQVLYSKTYSPKTSGAPIYEVMQALWQAPVCQSGALIAPEPLFFEPEMNTIFCRGVPGVHALDVLAEVDLNDVAAKSGVALAGLQQSHLPLGSFRARQGEMHEFEEGMNVLVRYNADYDSRLEQMHEELWQRLPELPTLEMVPAHGAFRLPQLLLVENKIALLDFDGFLMSDPMMDVSSYLAHLVYLEVKGELTHAQCRTAMAHFTRAYADAAPLGLPAEVLQWYLALTLIAKQAKKCIRLARENHEVSVGQLVDIAEAVWRGEEKLVV